MTTVGGSAPPELVPARMINEVLYCERLCHLEWAQGEFEDNAFTVEGAPCTAGRMCQAARCRRAGRRSWKHTRATWTSS
ncbi:hypothetical protein A7982_12359 [Minicystis rosea]|nr:hypothetical protein A7982_12359 [Minicystis rosea]